MSDYALNLEKYAALARQVSAEGCVLLENRDQALPLKKGDRVAVFGRSAWNYYKSGLGSGGLVNTRYVVSILDALKACEDIRLDEKLMGIYEDWIKENPYDEGMGWGQVPWSQKEMPVTDEMAEMAKEADAAIVIVGRTAGEDQDNTATPGSYLLTDVEEDMIARVTAACSRTIVVLNVGNIIDMKWVEKYHPAAVLYVWQGGQEGGNGAVDVLTGRVNPCGKLTDTIARDITDYPSTKNFGDKEKNIYEEDVYVGYRYFETFARDKVLYPFGYGLSYTAFDVKSKIISVDDTQVTVEASVENTGNRPGREVVQVYIEAPAGKLGQPARKLAGFAKTGVLEPGGIETLTISCPKYGMASYDDGGATGHRSAWVLEEGAYTIYAGTDVRSAVPAGSFTQEFAVLEQLEEAYAPVEPFQRMKAVDVAAGSPAAGEIGSLAVGESQSAAVGSPAAVESQSAARAASSPAAVESQSAAIGSPAAGECQCTATGNQAAVKCQCASGRALVFEDAPLRTADMRKRLEENRGPELPCTGDRGYKLVDVLDGRVSMDDFVSQLSDEDLTHLFYGEGMCSPKVTPGTAAAFGGLTERLQDFGIPAACCSDGPSGIRMDCGTKAFSLPNGTLLGCTFDEKLVEELYRLTGQELRLNKVDSLLGPGMNIHRSPLNGRNFEYISEDPLVTGKIAAAQVRAMASFGIGSTIKHFCGNNQEFGRRSANDLVSERALREIYLKGFEIAVKEGGARSVMTTYGAVNGLWTAGSYDLCTTILRKEWGFEGIVMTDWWAEANYPGERSGMKVKAPMAAAQNDLYMVVTDATANGKQDDLLSGLADGTVTRGDLQRNAKNILGFILKSPALLRMAGRIAPEELEEMNKKGDNDFAASDIKYYVSDENGTLVIDGSNLNPKAGNSDVFGVDLAKLGGYSITLHMRSDLGPLAQLPVSVYYDNSLKTVISVQGSEGKEISATEDLGLIFGRNHFIKLYYGANGLQIDRVVFRLEKEVILPGSV